MRELRSQEREYSFESKHERMKASRESIASRENMRELRPQEREWL
jgi:hypothetical protein